MDIEKDQENEFLYDSFLYSCPEPAFIWSIENHNIILKNNLATRLFQENGNNDIHDINQVISNWNEIPEEKNHIFWFKCKDSSGNDSLIQARNSYLNQDKSIVLSVLLTKDSSQAFQNNQILDLTSKVIESSSTVFCSQTDFLEGYQNFENMIQNGLHLDEICFLPDNYLENFDIFEFLTKFAETKDCFSKIQRYYQYSISSPRDELTQIKNYDQNAPENWFLFPIYNEEHLLGLYFLVLNDNDEKMRNVIFSISKIVQISYQNLIEKIEMTKSLYQNVFENVLNAKIVENVSEGIVITDDNGLIEFINNTAQLMFGFSLVDVSGHKIEDLLVAGESVRSLFEKDDLKNKEKNEPAETRYLHRRSGNIFPCQIRHFTINFNGKEKYHILILSDVTESEEGRQKNEQLIQRAFLGDFASLMAHEIKNPINNMGTWIQNIKSQCEPDSVIYGEAQRIEDDCDRVNNLVKNIQTFSHPLQLQLEEINFPMFLNEILEKWKINLSRANITYYLSAPKDFPSFFGDPRSLEQVFNNLIGNAVEAFEGKPGVISIKLELYQSESSRKQILISVSDNGPEIPEDKIGHIFEPFFTTKKKGNGWGLALTKKIITSHKGTIQVKSFPGGTVFEIFLPLSEGE